MATRKTAAAMAQPPLPASPKQAPSKFKPPKTLAAAADRMYTLREDRLVEERAVAKKVEPLKAEESFLREHIIGNLPKDDATGITGKLVRVTIKNGVVPVADDWQKIYEHICDEVAKAKRRKSETPYGIFAILGRSLNNEAIKELWEAGVAVPGVGRFNTKSLSVNKV